MNDLILKLQKYLNDALGIELSVSPWNGQKNLPFFLVNSYDFFEAFFLNNSCLLMVSKSDIELTPNSIQQHWKQVTNKHDTTCIYISSIISSYNRKRLITEYHIPFIIPNKQIYIPDLGLDLREYFKQQRISKKFFSPAAQVVILFALLKGKRERLIPSELAAELGYSLMTMTRAFNELEAAGIHKIITKGKERWWIVGEARDLWEQTKDMLRSPIRRIESMKLFPKGKMPSLLSGLSALAETTMINPPGIPIFAMGVEQYAQIGKGLQLSPADEAELVLEIWNYNPNLLSAHGRVDPFSLYLSLRDTTDERIEAALEELMEKVKW